MYVVLSFKRLNYIKDRVKGSPPPFPSKRTEKFEKLFPLIADFSSFSMQKHAFMHV